MRALMRGFVFFAMLGTAAPEARADGLRILSYNVWGVAMAGKLSALRLPRIGRALASADFDVVTVQEAFQGCLTKDEPRMLVENSRFPFYARGSHPDWLKLQCASSGLLVLSRHPILKIVNQRFSDCAGNDCFAAKGVVLTRILHPTAGEIDVYTTHLNASQGNGAVRVRQARQIVRFVDKHSGDRARPVILTGDLNAESDSAEVRTLVAELGLRDAFAEHAAGSPGAAADGFTMDPDRNANVTGEPHGRRIDFLLVREAAGRRAEVADSRLEFEGADFRDKPLSDHFGVSGTFSIR